MARQWVLPSFPIGVNFGSSCEHWQYQRNASIQVPPVIKSSCRIPQFSHGRPFVKVNLHCFVRASATHAVPIISASRFLWCKMTASARIYRVLRTSPTFSRKKWWLAIFLGAPDAGDSHRFLSISYASAFFWLDGFAVPAPAAGNASRCAAKELEKGT